MAARESKSQASDSVAVRRALKLVFEHSGFGWREGWSVEAFIAAISPSRHRCFCGQLGNDLYKGEARRAREPCRQSR